MPIMYPPQDGALFQGPSGAVYRGSLTAGTNISSFDQGTALSAGWRFAPILNAPTFAKIQAALPTVLDATKVSNVIPSTSPDYPTVTSTNNAARTGGTLARQWNPVTDATLGYQSIGSGFCSLFRAPVWDQYYGNGVVGRNATSIGGYPSMSNAAAAYHYGSAIEIVFQATSGGSGFGWSPIFYVKVNGKYVAKGTPSGPGTTGSNYFSYKYTFPAADKRLIEVIWDNGIFTGFNTGATDQLQQVPQIGPTTVILTDSFGQSPGGAAAPSACALDSFGSVFADYMGWNNVMTSFWPGAGWGHTGSSGITLLQAIPNVTAIQNAQLVILTGSTNDSGNAVPAATVATNLAAAIAQVQAALPTAVVAVYGPTFMGGFALQTPLIWAIRDAMKATAAAAGVLYIDPLTTPLETQLLFPGTSYQGGSWIGLGQAQAVPAASTVVAAVASGASSFSTTGTGPYALPFPAAYVINKGAANQEYVLVTAQSGTGVCTIDGTFQQAHSVGEPVLQVGRGCIEGHGQVGTTTGFGNSDIARYSDGVHPTSYGSFELGTDLATRILASLRQPYLASIG